MSTKIILGSVSPRRREILSFFSLPFRQESPEFDETEVPFRGNPADFVQEIARLKGLALVEKFPHEVILTADTTVYKNGHLFQKPESMQEAHAMLRELSGKKHQVFSGVAVTLGKQQFIGVEESTVEFIQLTDAEIKTYAETFHSLDKAGGYAIQKGGSLIVKRIEGCYYNIMGLPLQTVRRLLLQVGIDLWDFFKSL